MPGPISPENQSLIGLGGIAYASLVIGGAYYLAKRDASKPLEASDRTKTPLSSTTHSMMGE